MVFTLVVPSANSKSRPLKVPELPVGVAVIDIKLPTASTPTPTVTVPERSKSLPVLKFVLRSEKEV